MTLSPRHQRGSRLDAALYCLLGVLAAGSALAHGPTRSTLPLYVADGRLEVTIRPDGRSALPIRALRNGHWIFTGSTADLVGRSYTVSLHNRSSERLKVVLGIDGLNVYRKVPLAGSADEDIGSILPPWSQREIPGWQLDSRQAQRFLFSPSEWSEATGETEHAIGTLRVEVYQEARRRWSRDRRDPRPDSEFEGADESSRKLQESESASRESRVQRAPGPPIGTSSGEEVDHRVRYVSFVASTVTPVTAATLNYGSESRFRSPPRPESWLGLELRPTSQGSRVSGVWPNSPAARVGLETGDIIHGIDGRQRPGPQEVFRIWRGKEVGQYLFLKVRRGRIDLSLKAPV